MNIIKLINIFLKIRTSNDIMDPPKHIIKRNIGLADLITWKIEKNVIFLNKILENNFWNYNE